MSHLGLELIIKLWVVEFNKAKEERSFVCNAIVLWNLVLHVLL